MKRWLMIALALVAAMPAAAFAHDDPPSDVVSVTARITHRPDIAQDVAAARAYWRAEHRRNGCEVGERVAVYAADIANPPGYVALGRAYLYGCDIWLSGAALASLDRAHVCELVVHEYGHLTGLPDVAGDGMMQSDVLAHRQLAPACAAPARLWGAELRRGKIAKGRP